VFSGRYDRSTKEPRTSGSSPFPDPPAELVIVESGRERPIIKGTARMDTPLWDHAGELQGFAKVTRDVTERKRLEDELRRRAEQLAEADHRKDEFIAILAHELRNPLSSMTMAARLVRILEPGEQRDWSLGVIDNQIKTLTRLIEDLLDVSRISKGKIRLQHEFLDLSPVISRAVDSVSQTIKEREHQLDVSTPREPMMAFP
jgi:signal transduction histidine kinase